MKGLIFAATLGILNLVCGAVPPSAASAKAPAGAADPLAAMLASLKLRPDSRVAVVVPVGSCEASELAGMIGARRAFSLERSDLARGVRSERCTTTAAVEHLAWNPPAEIPISARALDLLWMAGGFQSLKASLPPAGLRSTMCKMVESLSEHGSLIIADRMRAVGSAATFDESGVDPQAVLEEIEACGLRLQTFANDAEPARRGHPAVSATRFAMLFRRV